MACVQMVREMQTAMMTIPIVSNSSSDSTNLAKLNAMHSHLNGSTHGNVFVRIAFNFAEFVLSEEELDTIGKVMQGKVQIKLAEGTAPVQAEYIPVGDPIWAVM